MMHLAPFYVRLQPVARFLQGNTCHSLHQEGLRSSLRGVLRKRLAAVGWPPPLSSAAGSSLGAEPDASSQQWHGFEQADPMVRALQRLLLFPVITTAFNCGDRLCTIADINLAL